MKQRSFPLVDLLESRTFFTVTAGIGGVTALSGSGGTPIVATPVVPTAPSPIGTGVPVHAIQNVAFDDELGTIPALPLAFGRTYYGTVHWGDGTTSPATFTSPSTAAANPVATGVEVFGAHKYAAPGMFSIVVDISIGARPVAGKPIALATPTVLVPLGDLDTTPSVAASPLTFTATSGKAYNGSVGSFATTLTLANYTTVVSISWGDGTSSTGTIVYDGDGVYHVVGTHVYAKPGDYTVHVGVTAQRPVPTGPTSTATGVVTLPPVILVASFDSTADVISGGSTAA
jgi:hypothetical protein